MRKRIYAAAGMLLAAALMAQGAMAEQVTSFGAPQPAQVEEPAPAEEPAEAVEPGTEAAAPAEGGADALAGSELYDFTCLVDGETYAFPMTVDEFKAKGWTLEETEDLAPRQYAMVTAEKKNGFSADKATAYVINFDINTLPMEECVVAGLEIEAFYVEPGKGLDTVLPGGITRGVSTLDDIYAAYGDATDVYEGDYYTSVTYEMDYDKRVELKVGTESGVLEDVEIRNFVVPEGFVTGEANDEVPEAVAAYARPEALGDDLTSFTVDFDGALYVLPVPVSVLVEDGWTIDEAETDPVISAKDYGWVTLRKDNNKTISTIVNNFADYATNPSNCWITSLTGGGYSGEGITMALPCGIELGMDSGEFVEVLDGLGYEYEVEEGDDYAYYTLYDENYNGYDFYTSSAENEYYAPSTLYEIDMQCRP